MPHLFLCLRDQHHNLPLLQVVEAWLLHHSWDLDTRCAHSGLTMESILGLLRLDHPLHGDHPVHDDHPVQEGGAHRNDQQGGMDELSAAMLREKEVEADKTGRREYECFLRSCYCTGLVWFGGW